MSSIIELLKNKEVKFIKNKKAPRGCYIEIIRNKENIVIEFKTIFALKGNSSTERNDSRSAIGNSTSEDWETFNLDNFNKELSNDKDKLLAIEKEQLKNRDKIRGYVEAPLDIKLAPDNTLVVNKLPTDHKPEERWNGEIVNISPQPAAAKVDNVTPVASKYSTVKK